MILSPEKIQNIQTAVRSTNPVDFCSLEYTAEQYGQHFQTRLNFGVDVERNIVGSLSIKDDKETHVVLADRLQLKYPVLYHQHQFASIVFENVCHVCSHGYRIGQTWYFANDLPVVSTVVAYNKLANLYQLPEISFIASCNPIDSRYGTQFKSVAGSGLLSQVAYPNWGIIRGGTYFHDGIIQGNYIAYDDSQFMNLEKLAETHVAYLEYLGKEKVKQLSPDDILKINRGEKITV